MRGKRVQEIYVREKRGRALLGEEDEREDSSRNVDARKERERQSGKRR
jgi:hypothetical protein